MHTQHLHNMPCILVRLVILFATWTGVIFFLSCGTSMSSQDKLKKACLKLKRLFFSLFKKCKLVTFLLFLSVHQTIFKLLCCLGQKKLAASYLWKRIIWTKEKNQMLRLDSDPNFHINKGLLTILKLIPCSCHYLPEKTFLYFNIYCILYSVLSITFNLS